MGLSLVLEETGDALAQIWAKLPVAAEAVLMLIEQQGNVVAMGDLDAAIMSRRRLRRALRQACTDLRYAGFLVSEEDGVRCSPLLLGLWAQRQDLSRASELQQMVAATDQLPHARSRARIKSHSHSSAPAPI